MDLCLYKVRSIAGESTRQFERSPTTSRRAIAWYSLSFNEELSAFDGSLLVRAIQDFTFRQRNGRSGNQERDYSFVLVHQSVEHWCGCLFRQIRLTLLSSVLST